MHEINSHIKYFAFRSELEITFPLRPSGKRAFIHKDDPGGARTERRDEPNNSFLPANAIHDSRTTAK